MANNLLGSAAMLWGWLRVLLVGKKRALEKIHGITTMEVAR
jgi:hypothetical protein